MGLSFEIVGDQGQRGVGLGQNNQSPYIRKANRVVVWGEAMRLLKLLGCLPELILLSVRDRLSKLCERPLLLCVNRALKRNYIKSIDKITPKT